MTAELAIVMPADADPELRAALGEGSGGFDLGATVRCDACGQLLAELVRHDRRLVLVEYRLDHRVAEHLGYPKSIRKNLRLEVDGQELTRPNGKIDTRVAGYPRWLENDENLNLRCTRHGDGELYGLRALREAEPRTATREIRLHCAPQ